MFQIAANEQFFSRFAKRLRHPLGGFKGTPLAEVEHIMGDKMHTIERVRYALRHESDFATLNGHLAVVPFSREELEWAGEHHVVPTINSRSVQRMMHVGRDFIALPDRIRNECEALMCSRPRTSWQLFMRMRTQKEEEKAIREQPTSLKKRQYIPPLGLVLSAMVVDLQACGWRPPLTAGERLTQNVVEEPDTKRVMEHIIVSVSPAVTSDGKPTPPIQVKTSRIYAELQPFVAWKPRVMHT